MAPEIWENGEYDGRQIDIWSAGATLLVCLLGDYAWAAPTRIPVESQGIYRYSGRYIAAAYRACSIMPWEMGFNLGASTVLLQL